MLLYIWETEEETPEKSGRPQLKSPVWLDLLPAPAVRETKAKVARISKAMKASTTIATSVRVMPATVLASRGEKLLTVVSLFWGEWASARLATVRTTTRALTENMMTQ